MRLNKYTNLILVRIILNFFGILLLTGPDWSFDSSKWVEYISLIYNETDLWIKNAKISAQRGNKSGKINMQGYTNGFGSGPSRTWSSSRSLSPCCSSNFALIFNISGLQLSHISWISSVSPNNDLRQVSGIKYLNQMSTYHLSSTRIHSTHYP